MSYIHRIGQDGTVYIDHDAVQKAMRRMSAAKLAYIAKDAREAVEANPEGPKAGYYADECLYAEIELTRRSDAFIDQRG